MSVQDFFLDLQSSDTSWNVRRENDLHKAGVIDFLDGKFQWVFCAVSLELLIFSHSIEVFKWLNHIIHIYYIIFVHVYIKKGVCKLENINEIYLAASFYICQCNGLSSHEYFRRLNEIKIKQISSKAIIGKTTREKLSTVDIDKREKRQ